MSRAKAFEIVVNAHSDALPQVTPMYRQTTLSCGAPILVLRAERRCRRLLRPSGRSQAHQLIYITDKLRTLTIDIRLVRREGSSAGAYEKHLASERHVLVRHSFTMSSCHNFALQFRGFVKKNRHIALHGTRTFFDFQGVSSPHEQVQRQEYHRSCCW